MVTQFRGSNNFQFIPRIYYQGELIDQLYNNWFMVIDEAKHPTEFYVSRGRVPNVVLEELNFLNDGVNGIYKVPTRFVVDPNDEDALILGLTYTTFVQEDRSRFMGGNYFRIRESDIFLSQYALSASSEYLSFVIGHEAGHSLGFGHVQDFFALMKPTLSHDDLEPGRYNHLTQYDEALAHHVYGQRVLEDRSYTGNIPLNRVTSPSDNGNEIILVSKFYLDGSEKLCVKYRMTDNYCDPNHELLTRVTD